MRYRNRMPTWFAIVIALIAIGIVSSILNGGRSLIVPVVIIAIVWFLYKFPPNRWSQGRSAPRSDYQRAAAQSKKRQQAKESAAVKPRRGPSPFRVIEGSKGKDDEPPTYH